jgi:monoamine oxidase
LADADVIVVGAGAAGLAAARSLARRSLDVVLLEARDRVGGRVWSRRIATGTTPAELGAEFIHGPAPQTRAILRAIGGAAIETGGESWVFREGRLEPDADDFIASAGIFEGARALGADESVERFLRRFDGDRALRETVESARAFVEGFEAADPAIASARAIADEWRSGVDSTSARPRDGYAPLFDRLLGDCVSAGLEPRLSAAARRISWRRGGVTIEAAGAGGRSQTFRARAAILTLPVGVLRHRDDETAIAFEPALPAMKREALEKIEMGHVVKVALWFRTPFWERVHGGRYRLGAFFHVEGKPIPAYWTQLPQRSELAIAWAGGPKATALLGLSPEERIERALDGFGELFGEPVRARSEFDGALTHDWSDDPFARGAYSYVAVGGGNARAELAAPVDETLFFAGEATSSDGQGGTVNGALETGERAGAQAVAALGVKSSG